MPTIARPIEERFWEKVIPEPNSGCWLWTGASDSKGYGSFRGKHGAIISAPRVAYALTYGEIPKGKWVLHKCDNRACVNPEHLYVGTRAQNNQDAYDRGRQPYRGGSLHSRAVLTAKQVKEVRSSGADAKWLAQKYGCHICTIYRVRWKKRYVNG